MSPLSVLFIAGFTLTIGDLIAGKWVEESTQEAEGKSDKIKALVSTRILYLLVLLFYMVGLNFLIYTYKYEDISVASVTMEIFNIIILTIAGRFLFKEKISKTELLGIFIGIIAITLLEFA